MNIVNVFVELGKQLSKVIHADEQHLNGLSAEHEKWSRVIRHAEIENKWFTRGNVIKAFEGIIALVEEQQLRNFVAQYSVPVKKPVRVGVIFAGNIPMVGFHDLMCVLLSGNNLIAKFSSDDKVLMGFIVEELIAIEPALKNQIEVVERLNTIDAIIATGSNNSSRYFDYYFGKYPHVFRKNRTAIAIIDGTETGEELTQLGSDIFTYFGLGCRNVSKLYVPKGYVFDTLFECIHSFGDELLMHNKYLNNFDYHRALFLLELIPFLTNNFLIIKEGEALSTPVSVLNYEYYTNLEELKQKLIAEQEQIQCLVSKNKLDLEALSYRSFYFGEAQMPAIADFADGVDTMAFLVGLGKEVNNN